MIATSQQLHDPTGATDTLDETPGLEYMTDLTREPKGPKLTTTTPNTAIGVNSKLADIINVAPGSARVLEGFGLDYCCHGQRNLEDACGEAGIDPDNVLDSLVELDLHGQDGPDWLAMSAGELARHVESVHHGYLHAEMPRLAALAIKVASVHAERHPELSEIRDTYLELQTELTPHLHKEEQVLFPAIRRLDGSHTEVEFPFGSIEHPISHMLTEHDEAGELIAHLHELSGGYEYAR